MNAPAFRDAGQHAPCGRLVLVPNTLDLATVATPIDQVLGQGVLQRAASLRHWAVESAKTSRAFLKRVAEHSPLVETLQSLDIRELPRARKGGGDAIPDTEWVTLLKPALAGEDVGLLSEAGLPAVADPGALLVAAAHRLGLVVEALAGASSITLALAASGLNGQRFAFEGYLPQDAGSRAQRVRQLEARSQQEGQTQVVIETPYRNPALLSALVLTLKPDTRLGVACGLTSAQGWCRTRTVAEWRKLPSPLRQGVNVQMSTDLPAVFMWLA
jgi:16S rRNA (cytidine1402-2'-O)-methyltransferase